MPSKRTIPRTCVICAAAFLISAFDVAYGHGRGTYCSNACRYLGQRAPRTALERACRICGSPFTVPPSQVQRGGRSGVFCSQACRNVEDHATARTLTCERCGAPFVRTPSQIAKGTARHCSRACQFETRRLDALPLADRFWPNVQKSDEPSGCWLWMRSRARGYGQIGLVDGYKRPQLTHRAAWMLATGEHLRPDQIILHTCDVRACVRNDDEGIYVVMGRVLPRHGHLARGTHGDNVRDMVQKGQMTRGPLLGLQHPDGERHLAGKLTGLDRLAICHLVAVGLPRRYISQRFGISEAAIQRVAHSDAPYPAIDEEP